MEKPKFRTFYNEEGSHSIVYDQNGENERIVGYVNKRAIAENSVRELNHILFLEREKLNELKSKIAELLK